MKTTFTVPEAAAAIGCDERTMRLAVERKLVHVETFPACRNPINRTVITRVALVAFAIASGHPTKGLMPCQ